MNFDDYEQLPGSPPVLVSLIAGASAGVMEHISMYPVDTIKVRKSFILGCGSRPDQLTSSTSCERSKWRKNIGAKRKREWSEKKYYINIHWMFIRRRIRVWKVLDNLEISFFDQLSLIKFNNNVVIARKFYR